MLLRSLNSAEVKVYKVDRQRIIRLVRKYAANLVRTGKAELVILFGSFARGDYTPFSDIDLLIISNNVSDNPVERLKDYMTPELPLDVEPRVYTRDEFYRLAMEKRRIIGEILRFGIILAGDKEIVKNAETLYGS